MLSRQGPMLCVQESYPAVWLQHIVQAQFEVHFRIPYLAGFSQGVGPVGRRKRQTDVMHLSRAWPGQKTWYHALP